MWLLKVVSRPEFYRLCIRTECLFMKSSEADRQRVQHIREAINHIENFTENVDYETYTSNLQLRLALVKLLEIIGEAASVLSDELRNEFSDIEWRTLKAVRNVLVHEYFGINYEILWTSIQHDIPILRERIDLLMASRFSE